MLQHQVAILGALHQNVAYSIGSIISQVTHVSVCAVNNVRWPIYSVQYIYIILYTMYDDQYIVYNIYILYYILCTMTNI